MERLQKIISRAGAASRREAERMILAGRVQLNGQVVTELGVQAEAGQDEIAIDGQVLQLAVPRLYFLLNKPQGYISAVKDDRGRKTVVELLPEVKEYIYPVLTNDGEMMNGLLHPSYEIDKTYIAQAQGVVKPGQLEKLAEGILLDDGMTAPAQVKLLKQAKDNSSCLVQLTIHEGRNRQVRRMLQAVGHKVLKLRRVGFAGLDLKGLAPGSYRELKPEEVAGLKKLAGVQK